MPKPPYLITAALALLAVAAACLDRRPPVEESVRLGEHVKGAPKSFPAPDEAVHLIYWEKWNNFEGEAMQACVNAFNAHSEEAWLWGHPERIEGAADRSAAPPRPGHVNARRWAKYADATYRQGFLSPDGRRIHVHMLSVSQVNKKTRLAVSGGNPPDVAGLWSRDVPVFAQYNAALPLDDWIARDGPDPAEYHKCYWDMCVYEGRTWALLTTPATIALHWNKELFAAAGLDPERPPRTLEELDEFNAKLTKRDAQGRIMQMGFLPTEPGWWNYAWGNWFGGRHVSDDGRTILCDTQPWLDAYAWLNRMADFYGRSEVKAFQGAMGNFDSPENGFISGKVAMVIQGVWMANFIRNYNPSMSWGAAPFPAPAAAPGNPVTIAQADVLIVPRDCPHPEEAWRFVRFVNSRDEPNDPDAEIDGMEILCLGQGKHSPFKTATRAFLQDHPHERLQVFVDLAASRHAIIEPLMPMWEEYRRACISSFEELWTKGHLEGHGPADVLSRLKARMQPKLDREWEKLDRLRAR
ncbi:MAG: extracellular solute-binding protein [Planctomycetota bacterium]|nr:extracellular solute-binding protein [Planctomycetota bacterium]